MTVNLCESFRALAFSTFDQMGKGRRVGHQPLEETFTDTNILELKDRHSSEIYSQTYNKYEEGINGADWEWWLTNSSRSLWLGLRVQAKILNFKSNSFVHLHYKSGKTKAYQLSKLKRQSAKDGLVPLYCFYVHVPRSVRTLGHRCRSFAHAVESYGCSIAPLSHVESLQKRGEVKDLSSVMAGALPWHCLVCCSGYGGRDLPSRAWSLLKSEFGFKEPRKQSRGEKILHKPIVGPRMDPPDYVKAAMEGYEPDISPVGVRGILVIVGRDNS